MAYFVRRAEDVRIGGVGLFGGHLVTRSRPFVMKADISARPPSSSMNCGVEPGFVDLELGVDEESVAVETLDVVALVGAAVAPDVDVVFLHRGDEHGAGDSAADGGGVEVGDAGGGDVEGSGLEGGEAFADKSGRRQSMRRARSAPYSRALRGISS